MKSNLCVIFGRVKGQKYNHGDSRLFHYYCIDTFVHYIINICIFLPAEWEVFCDTKNNHDKCDQTSLYNDRFQARNLSSGCRYVCSSVSYMWSFKLIKNTFHHTMASFCAGFIKGGDIPASQPQSTIFNSPHHHFWAHNLSTCVTPPPPAHNCLTHNTSSLSISAEFISSLVKKKKKNQELMFPLFFSTANVLSNFTSPGVLHQLRWASSTEF